MFRKKRQKKKNKDNSKWSDVKKFGELRMSNWIVGKVDPEKLMNYNEKLTELYFVFKKKGLEGENLRLLAQCEASMQITKDFHEGCYYIERMNFMMWFIRENKERLRFMKLVIDKRDEDHVLFSKRLFDIFSWIDIPKNYKMSFKTFHKAFKKSYSSESHAEIKTT